jgi:hypothetical protein
MTLEGWGTLPLPILHFLVLMLEVCHVYILVPIKRGREGGDLRGSFVNLVDVNGKFRFLHLL